MDRTNEIVVQWNKDFKQLGKLNDLAYDFLREVKNENLSTEDMVIYMNYRRIIELISGTCTLLSERLGGMADSLLRDLMEAFAHLAFITENKDQVNERALAYYYQHLRNSLTEMYDLKNLYSEDKKSVREIQSSISQLRQEQQSLELAAINEKWKKSDYNYPSYFSFFLNHNSITRFVHEYAPKEIEKKLYSFTSTQVHGLNTFRDLEMLKEKGDISEIYYLRSDSKVVPNASVYLVRAMESFLLYFDMMNEDNLMKMTGALE